MSVRVPPSGSRGPRYPRVGLRLGNRMMLRQFRKGRGRTRGGIDTLMLETVGSKSGQRRQSVLGSLTEGDDAWLVIAALAGARRHPSWLYNLAVQPDVAIEFKDGRRVDVHAETLEGDDLAAAWERIGREAPEFPTYRTQTDRELPVVRLRRR